MDRQKKHQLQELFFITLCAVICEADHWVAITPIAVDSLLGCTIAVLHGFYD